MNRDSYCTTPFRVDVSISFGVSIGISKMLSLKFFMWWASPIQVSYGRLP